ncbi:MAG: class I SAM-dependent methyltransferase [Candidatus Berkiella sp.]
MKAKSPSQTAVWIAKGLLYLNQTHHPLAQFMDSKSIELWENAISILEPRWLTLLQKPWYRCWFGFLERISIPGMFAHYAMRKKIIDGWMLRALQEKIEQVIVLAAGFDTLTQRYYQQYPEVEFIEIDHPATQAIKQKAFMMGNPQASNVVFVAANLENDSIRDIFEQHCLSFKKTLLIAEGITMYLTEDNLKRFFRELHFFKPDFSTIFTFMQKQASGSIQFSNASFIVDFWLTLQNETFKWGIEPEYLAKEFLEPLQFKQVELVDPSLHTPPPKTQGEWLCLAEALYD